MVMAMVVVIVVLCHDSVGDHNDDVASTMPEDEPLTTMMPPCTMSCRGRAVMLTNVIIWKMIRRMLMAS